MQVCHATPSSQYLIQSGVMRMQAKEAAKQLDAEQLAALPGPGKVDFLCGGPPCQGYSGMNRFNKGVKPCARPLLVALRSVLASTYAQARHTSCRTNVCS